MINHNDGVSRPLVSLSEFDDLIERVANAIQSDVFGPDSMLALSTGGFPVAAALAKRLGISGRHVIGLPAYKDETGDYHLDESLVQLRSPRFPATS